MPRFTPTEEKIIEVLSDGRRHLKIELEVVLPDGQMNGNKALPQAISKLRKKLNPIGEDIICEYNSRRIHYRHVRLISQD